MSLKGRLVAGTALGAIAMITLVSEAAAQRPPVEQAAPKKTGKKNHKDAKKEKIADKPAATDAQPNVSNEDGRLAGDIVVVGLRENVKSARSAKRNAHQIVDVVLAQDIGKLPDKNVPEALARVPGVQIDRDRGEGGKALIRGLDNVMTTVNGSPTFSAGDRTTYLNDISSDLVAGIEVYKTRTPDQVEGSQTGVINLTLRRPTDFKQGVNYALSARGDYSDRIKKVNPYYSALVNYTTDSNIGKIGFMVNGTYNDVRYNEPIRFNEIPRQLTSIRQSISPSTTPANIYLPFRVGFAGTDGWSKRAAFQSSAQWKPDNHWAFTLEGGFSDQKMLWADSSLWIPINYSESAVPPPALSNIVMADDGRLVKSVSLYGTDPIGPGRDSWKHNTKNYNGRFQVQFNNDRIDFNGWFNYQRSNNASDQLSHYIRFSQQPKIDVVFNDTTDPYGGPSINFRNIDTLDPKNYVYIDGFTQAKIFTKSAEKEWKADLKLNTFNDFIDYLKIGYRWNRRTYDSGQGWRTYGALRVPISSLPDYKLTSVGANYQSGSNANWLIGDSDSIRKNFSAIRGMFSDQVPDLLNPYPQLDPRAAFKGADGAFAAYGFFHYNVHLLFPIEGDVGARVVNSFFSLKAIQRIKTREDVDGTTTDITTDTIETSTGNHLDVLPSLNAIIRFTPKLQLRLASTYDVWRPSVQQMNPVLTADFTNPARLIASGGNAQLGPTTTKKLDASLEWYFGATGSASIAVWQWKQDGLVGYLDLPEYLPVSPEDPVLVRRPRNLGRGRHRGIEAQATSFFTFLPGVLKSFGASVNGTLNITRQAFPEFSSDGTITYSYGPYLNVSKYIYNLTGFFERGGLNVRLAYNWQSRRQWNRSNYNPYQNLFRDPVERLDAAINYDINKNLTIGIEGSNLTRSGNRAYWGSYDIPNEIRYFSRNFSLAVRSRF
jgi:iron complex outermembrane receptor protein